MFTAYCEAAMLDFSFLLKKNPTVLFCWTFLPLRWKAVVCRALCDITNCVHRHTHRQIFCNINLVKRILHHTMQPLRSSLDHMTHKRLSVMLACRASQRKSKTVRCYREIEMLDSLISYYNQTPSQRKMHGDWVFGSEDGLGRHTCTHTLRHTRTCTLFFCIVCHFSLLTFHRRR